MRLAPYSWSLPLAFLLVACGSYSPRAVQPGMSVQQVADQMGSPTAVHALPGGGRRLEYARGPAGLHTFMIDIDPQGRVTDWQQVLTEAQFNAIPPGLPVEELMRRIGRPSDVRGGGWQPGQVWSYRFDSRVCQWWQVDIVNGRTGRSAYGADPRCEAGDDRLS
ncbi:hypothetical protein JI739_06400 [Ramlibacter sp. AW1]|uniref:Outer membrane protein assembly factor BamE n=1 Tax=Ramlibacter aurantiacus TaxID=2801330 RepID=A0A936ZME8_9BURK|nr:hypothetical protein [Ramlibacter aurantiacus]MBL0419973.1 hypothetical protein [Ramlibacter aurantiacus]